MLHRLRMHCGCQTCAQCKFRWQQENTEPSKDTQHATQCAAVLNALRQPKLRLQVPQICAQQLKDGVARPPVTAGRVRRVLPQLTPDMLRRLRLRLRRRRNTRSCWRTSEPSREASSSLAATMLRLQGLKSPVEVLEK